MCPLQRPRPSPPADAGIRLLCPVPVTSGRTGAAAATTGGGKFKNFKKCHFFFFLHFTYFTYILSRVLCPAPCLHFVCSFCLETEKRPWHPKSVPLGQKRFRSARKQR
ncbi:unnamed protein product [Staurois parvus]|uniref:Secreted protein n=1 Tax=Staurois parvus TaxID=386267 RepID=A0ABN9BD52_9NEOB|nr:unnamed protein product [Staurois parvus]